MKEWHMRSSFTMLFGTNDNTMYKIDNSLTVLFTRIT